MIFNILVVVMAYLFLGACSSYLEVCGLAADVEREHKKLQRTERWVERHRLAEEMFQEKLFVSLHEFENDVRQLRESCDLLRAKLNDRRYRRFQITAHLLGWIVIHAIRMMSYLWRAVRASRSDKPTN